MLFLVREEGDIQYPIYYVSKRMLDAETHYMQYGETRYTNMQNALILASRKLRPYFRLIKLR